MQVPRRLRPREEILYTDDSHRPHTSPATSHKQFRNTTSVTRPGNGLDLAPCTENSEELLFRSWQCLSEDTEQVEDSENKEVIRCMTAGGAEPGSGPTCKLSGVVVLDWFLPAGSTVRHRKSHTEFCPPRVSVANSRKTSPLQHDYSSTIQAEPLGTTPWASR